MTAIAPLPNLLIEPLVRMALAEDFGRAGDITSQSCIAAGTHAVADIVARRPGRLAGLDLAALAFRLVDPAVAFTVHRPDGSDLEPGTAVATIAGPARALLSAERVALNFLTHLSGIATATARMVRAVAGSGARIACTRKTTPGLRLVEKYAVRVGGGHNHRFGLDDAVMIKDNHIVAAGGIAPAVARARAAIGHMVKIEVEIDRLDQLDEALAAGADVILLDNMAPPQLREAVGRIAGRAVAEASGSVTPETVGAIAATGVDVISVGWLTHSAPALDLGLDFRG